MVESSLREVDGEAWLKPPSPWRHHLSDHLEGAAAGGHAFADQRPGDFVTTILAYTAMAGAVARGAWARSPSITDVTL
jgi:hypothetical protein